MEIKILSKALAFLLSVVTGFMALCMLFGLLDKEGVQVLIAFGPSLALGLLCFLPAAFLLRIKRGASLSNRSGYLFVVLAWLLASLVGALPYCFYKSVPALPDAIFETMSGFTTTGASVITEIEALPRSILLWRAMTHWLGGMGIVVLTVAIFPFLGFKGRAVMEAESPGPQVDKITPRLSQTAKIMWLIYLGLTVILTILLMFGGLSLFDSIAHAFAAMATGGFSTRNASVGAYDSAYVDGMLTAFMILAGMNFSLYWKLLRGQALSVLRDTELRVYLAIFATASLVISWNLFSNASYGSFIKAFRYASFQVSSILTTTGSATADYTKWPALSQSIIFTLMFIGGCAGSTSGGPKVSRIVTLFKMGLSEMRYLLNPRGVYGVFVDGKYQRKYYVYDIAAMVFLYLMSAFASTLVVSAFGYDVLSSLTATMACLGNIGPGFGLVGPASNFGFMPGALKLWLSFIMLLGRLEVYTVLVLFTKSFWDK
ncbi:TrkH family potassium uptake protein [Spirochaetota bacterium]